MKQRIITGVILIFVAMLWLFGANYEFFVVGSMFISLVGAYEFAQFVFAEKLKRGTKLAFFNKAIYAMSACAIIAALSLFGNFTPDVLVKLEASYEANGQNFQNIFAILNPVISGTLVVGALWWILASILVIFYPKSSFIINSKIVKGLCGYLTLIPFYFSLLILRVQFYHANVITGAVLVLSVMALIWCTDSGAYFTGKAIGKHKMSPNVSPNKTIEGLLGGIVLAMVAFVIIYFVGGFGSSLQAFSYSSNFIALSLASLLAIIISVFGDLTESMFKREAGIKDSGVIFPGHGGMLDRIDSLSAALPMFVVVYSLLM